VCRTCLHPILHEIKVFLPAVVAFNECVFQTT
jgi:hypothetical protein